MLIYNPNDSIANWIPCHGWNGSMKYGLFFSTSVSPPKGFLRTGSSGFANSWLSIRSRYMLVI